MLRKHKLYLLAFLVCLGVVKAGLSQQQEADSLKQAIKKLAANPAFESDTNYLNTLNALSFRLTYLKADSAILLANQAVSLSHEARYPLGEAEAYKNLGLAYNIMGNYDSAFAVYKKGLEITEKHGLYATAGRIYHNSAIVYTNLGKYPEALENYFRALKMREASGEILGQSSSTNGIGTLYFLQGNYTDAVRYYKRAMELAKTIDYKRGTEAGYANIGEVYFRLGRYDSAQINLFKALEVTKETGNLEILAFCNNMLGSVYLKENKNAEAKNAFEITGRVAEELQSKEYKCRSLIGIGQTFLNTRQYDSALYYVKAGYGIASDIKFLELMRDGSEILGNIYEAKGELRQALLYAKQFKQLADSINNQQVQQVTSNLEAEYEYGKKELLLKAAFESKNTRQRWIIFSILAAFFSSLVVVWLVYRSRQKEKHANQLLQQQKKEIEKQNATAEKALADLQATQKQLIQSEKMASLGELTAGIAHEIQNPLNFVNNFSELNKELIRDLKSEILKGNIEEVNALADDIESNEEKINHHGRRADAIVKGMLQHSRTSSGVKEPTDINAMADEYLRLVYHGLKAKDKSFNSNFETQLDPTLPRLKVIPQDIGRVLLNLINNAFYAVSEKSSGARASEDNYEPTVMVSTKNLGDKIEISVKDNGPGIPDPIKEKIFQPFFTTKPTGEGTGLGLSLSYDIIKAHGGEIRVESKEGEGTIFSIALPA